MDPAVLIAIISGTVTVILSIITLVSLLFTLRNNKELALISKNQELNSNHINDKVDTYHKEVDGKMTQLLETKKAEGVISGRAEQKAESTSTANETVEAIKADPTISIIVK